MQYMGAIISHLHPTQAALLFPLKLTNLEISQKPTAHPCSTWANIWVEYGYGQLP